MRLGDPRRRAAGIAARVGQGSPGHHLGRWICLNCPNDHHGPPFLPFALPIHIREHRERYVEHVIAWWCWDHLLVEESHGAGWRWAFDDLPTPQAPIHRNGGFPMTQPTAYGDAQLGVCLPCGNNWVITSSAQRCLQCGLAPSHAIPLPPAGDASSVPSLPASRNEASPAESVTLPSTCPECSTALDVTFSPEGVTILPSATPPTGEASVDDAIPPSDTDAPATSPEQEWVDKTVEANTPRYCPTHPTERLDEDGNCAPCRADAEAALRREATKQPDPAS